VILNDHIIGSIELQYLVKHAINPLRSFGQFIIIAIVGGIAGLIASLFRLVATRPYVFRSVSLTHASYQHQANPN